MLTPAKQLKALEDLAYYDLGFLRYQLACQSFKKEQEREMELIKIIADATFAHHRARQVNQRTALLIDDLRLDAQSQLREVKALRVRRYFRLVPSRPSTNEE